MTMLADFFNTELDARDVLEQIEEEKKSGDFEPLLKNVYKLTGDEGSVTVRILPTLRTFHNPKVPYQNVRKHFFMFKGLIYDSICAGWFDDTCAVCKFSRNEKINYNSSTSPYAKYYKGDFKNKIPRLNAFEDTWVNVYVVNDRNDTKNNGRIFQYKLPYSIKTLMTDIYEGNPEIKRAPNDPSNFTTGQDLYIKYQLGKNGFRNYDGSVFLAPSVAVDQYDKPLAQSSEFIKQVQDGLVQDLYDLVNPETRLYTPEESASMFSKFKELFDAELNGEDSGDSSRLDDGFSKEPTKKSTKMTESELDNLTKSSVSTSKKVETTKSTMDDDLANLENAIEEKTEPKGSLDDELASLLDSLDLED